MVIGTFGGLLIAHGDEKTVEIVRIFSSRQ